MKTEVPGSAGVSIPILVDPAPTAPVQEQVSSPHYEHCAPAQDQVYCFCSGAFCISAYHVQCANNNTKILILYHHHAHRHTITCTIQGSATATSSSAGLPGTTKVLLAFYIISTITIIS